MIRTPDNVRIEGIRPNNVGGWAVVGSRQDGSVVPGRSARTVVLIREFTGPGAKANAIDAAGTNRIVRSPIISGD
jgi:hypothetical protein